MRRFILLEMMKLLLCRPQRRPNDEVSASLDDHREPAAGHHGRSRHATTTNNQPKTRLTTARWMINLIEKRTSSSSQHRLLM
jgi:hypothetical protein